MQLTDLPVELLDQIFANAVEDRTFKRVMRLRLVNRKFKYLTDEAIFSSRILDDIAFDPEMNLNDAEHHDLPWTLYLRAYLYRRIYQERNAETMRGQYRKVAEHLWTVGSKIDPELSLKDCIYGLSGVTFFINSSLETSALLKSESVKDTFSKPQLSTLFLNALVYMGLEPFAKALIPEDPNEYWQCPTVAASTKPCLRRLLEMAAFRGHLNLVKHLVEVGKRITHSTWSFMSGSVASSILRYAAIAGHTDVMEYALANSNLSNERLTTTTRRNLGVALSYSKSAPIYERLASILDKDNTDAYDNTNRDSHYAHLDLATRNGNTQIVRALLQKDLCFNAATAQMNPEPPCDPDCDVPEPHVQFRPLLSAIESGCLETVELLLWQGADPNWFPTTRTALMVAVHRGNIDIVRTLLDYGARVDVGTPPPLVIAVQQEREDIFRLLEERGGLNEEIGAWAMAYACVFGLESMVGLLRGKGFRRGEVLHYTVTKEEAEFGGFLFRRGYYGLGALEFCRRSMC